MFNRYRKNLIALGVVISMLVLIACVEKKQEPLTLGTVVWVGYEPLYLGHEVGYIKSDEIKLVEFLSASQVMRAFRNKLIDVAALTLDEVMILLSEGVDLSVFLVVDISTGADAIVAQDKYKTFNDLIGKNVGYENTAVGAYLLSRALIVNEINSKEINLVSMRVNETEKALIEKKVDAVVTFEPTRSRLLEAGYSEVFSSRDIVGEIVDVLVIRKDAVEVNKEKIEQLVSGWFSSLEYFKENRETSLKIMNKRLKLSESTIASAFEGVIYPSRKQNLEYLGSYKKTANLISISNELAKQMAGQGLIDKGVDVDARAVFESTFLRD